VDPYCVLYLDKGVEQMYKTKIVPKASNPTV
jgi:hypothetical protein